MKKTLLALLALCCGLFSWAQQPDYEAILAAHPEYLAGTDFLCPTDKVPLTAAPKGYEAFYISHYGRHGARYAWQDDMYSSLNDLFGRAASHRNLTEVGKRFWKQYQELYPEVYNSTGILSPKGWRQQQELAALMYSNFPEVFPKGASVTARTSPSTRCIMTMSSFCLGLKGQQSGLDIVEYQGDKYLSAILPMDRRSPYKVTPTPISPVAFSETWEEYIERTIDYKAILARLFVDPSDAVEQGQEWDTVSYLYFFGAGMDSLDTDLDFNFIFTPEERVALWKIDCFQFYAQAWETHLGYKPIVEDIIAKAQERIDAGYDRGAELRFGHDYTFLPLLMTLDVDGYGTEVQSGDDIPIYCQVNRVPMGANLQLVFYKPRKGNGDVLLKALFNGEEAHLGGISTDNWPYYKWEDFKAYYSNIPAPDDVQVGPWVTAARSEGAEATAKILWTSRNDGMGWVELEDGSRIYDTFAGRRNVGRFHSVTLSGLPAGQAVRYRVGGQVLSDGSNAADPEFGDEYTHPWTSFKTLDNVSDDCHFSMFNDIHLNTDAYKSLASQVDSAATDFIFLCGDIASKDNYTLDNLVHYEIESIESLTSGIPVLFARGNHEGRGLGIKEVAKVFPQAEGFDQGGEFYYTFRQGPVAFIVFDGGETHEDRSTLYSGNYVYDEYIAEQVKWAERAIQRPAFKDAPVKVCLAHVPMIDHPDKTDYILQRYMNQTIVPILNEAGVDLMIGADLHTYMYCKEGTMNNDFPILVNRNEERLDFVYENGEINIKCFSASGRETHSLTIPVK